MCNLALDLDAEGNGNPFGLDVTGDDYLKNYRRQVGEFHFCRAWAYVITSYSIHYTKLYEEGNGNPFGLDVTGDDYLKNYQRQIGEFHFFPINCVSNHFSGRHSCFSLSSTCQILDFRKIER